MCKCNDVVNEISVNYEQIQNLDSLINEEDGAVIAVMHRIQEEYDYLPEYVIRELAGKLGMPVIELYRIATFYKHFSLTPKGRHKIVTCSGTACHVRGGEFITREISRMLDVKPGNTTGDGEYSLEEVGCLGACALAPLVVINGEYHANMTPRTINRILEEYQEHNGSCSIAEKEKVEH